jgi:hypothetical protein
VKNGQRHNKTKTVTKTKPTSVYWRALAGTLSIKQSVTTIENPRVGGSIPLLATKIRAASRGFPPEAVFFCVAPV